MAAIPQPGRRAACSAGTPGSGAQDGAEVRRLGLSTVDESSPEGEALTTPQRNRWVLPRGRAGHGAGKPGGVRCSREASRLPESRRGPGRAERPAGSHCSSGSRFSTADGTEPLPMCLLITMHLGRGNVYSSPLPLF